jgi:hypothetical protein
MVRKLDIGVAAALIVICVAVFLESLSMPPAFYDPIGPAAFPRANLPTEKGPIWQLVQPF